MGMSKKTRTLETTRIYSLSEQKLYRLCLIEVGLEKIHVFKAIRECNNSLGSAAAKQIIDNPPAVVAEVDTHEEAECIKQRLQLLGARIEIQHIQIWQ